MSARSPRVRPPPKGLPPIDMASPKEQLAVYQARGAQIRQCMDALFSEPSNEKAVRTALDGFLA